MKKQYYICTIDILDFCTEHGPDSIIGEEVLICGENEFKALITHIDKDKFRISDIQIITVDDSNNVYSFIKNNENLEFGTLEDFNKNG